MISKFIRNVEQILNKHKQSNQSPLFTKKNILLIMSKFETIFNQIIQEKSKSEFLNLLSVLKVNNLDEFIELIKEISIISKNNESIKIKPKKKISSRKKLSKIGGFPNFHSGSEDHIRLAYEYQLTEERPASHLVSIFFKFSKMMTSIDQNYRRQFREYYLNCISCYFILNTILTINIIILNIVYVLSNATLLIGFTSAAELFKYLYELVFNAMVSIYDFLHDWADVPELLYNNFPEMVECMDTIIQRNVNIPSEGIESVPFVQGYLSTTSFYDVINTLGRTLTSMIFQKILSKLLKLLGTPLACLFKNKYKGCFIRCLLTHSEIESHIQGIKDFYEWLYDNYPVECPTYTDESGVVHPVNMAYVAHELWIHYDLDIWDNLIFDYGEVTGIPGFQSPFDKITELRDNLPYVDTDEF